MEKARAHIRQIALALLAATVAVIWYAVFHFESRQNLVVTFFDIGQGDAILIEAPNGNQILIDGGPGDRILAKLGGTLPFWDRSLDLVILTHPHADHVTGLVDVLERYDVGMVLETGVNHSIPEYAEWRELLKEKDVKVITAKSGQRVQFSESARLDILTPFENFAGASRPNVHDAMLVSRLAHGSTTVLLMGDAEKSLEYRLLYSGDDLDADILKVGHHGSKTSSTAEFLAAVSPEIAVIQVGRKNRFGHPVEEVLERLEASGAKILRTDRDGDIRILSNGTAYELLR